MNSRFPLTLTLSRRERGQPLDTYLLDESLGAEFSRRLAWKLGAILPLRVGGVSGADGERAGVRCPLLYFGVQSEGERPE